MPYRLACIEVARLAAREGQTQARSSYLLGLADEIAALNRANSDPHFSWQALVSDDGSTFELVRSIRKNPNLD